MRCRTALIVFCSALSLTLVSAQRSVSPGQSYERAWAIVPMIGSGTDADPIRPKHAPFGQLNAFGAAKAPSRDGIIAFTYTLSDDGKSALVLFVAARRAGLKEVLDDPELNAFLKGRDTSETIEAEFRKHKKNFKIEDLRVAVQ